MITVRVLINRVKTWIRAYQSSWSTSQLKYLVSGHVDLTSSFCADFLVSRVAWVLDSRLLAGWYMIELHAVFQTQRLNAELILTATGLKNKAERLNFPLVSGRLGKRLIKITCTNDVKLFLIFQEKDIEIKKFRLQRITRRFSQSRMLTKLQSLHPRYKLHYVQSRRINAPNSLPLVDLKTMWPDYCELFDVGSSIVPYIAWLKEFHHEVSLPSADAFENNPLLSIVMPVFNPNRVLLEAALASVYAQSYPHWELCIADDASTYIDIAPLLQKHAHADARVKVHARVVNGHISAASNSALALAHGDWIVLLDHDDLLDPHALLWIVDAINKQPECRMIYSDEDKTDETGERSDPYFKPEWNQDLFYSQNMFSHLGVYHADLVRAVGGFRVGYEGSQDYDLALRCIERIKPSQIHHIPRVLYHWRMHAQSTAQSINAKPYAMLAGARALNDHFSRTGVDALADSVGYGYRVRYALPAVLPLVSLIIPTRNGLKLLRQCVQSILNKTTYANFEILIVDNGSNDAATLRYLKGLSADNRIRVLRDDRPFNYSQLNNTAVLQARGDVLGLVNNDIEVISPDWLTEMVSHAVRPGVGAVGARLWYADNTLQHAGVVLGLEGFAGHVHRYLPRGNVGYCGRAALTQSFSAVTGACLVVKKSSYLQVGGLNETDLAVACNDIDFCLKLLKAGYRNLWTPWADLYHHESSTRGFDDTPEKLARSKKEVAYMWQHWGDMLRNDPAYSPNLTLDASDFGLAWPPRLALTV